MKMFIKAIVALTVGLVITAACAVASLIFTLFTVKPGDSRQETFFGSLFVEANSKVDGSIGLEMGLASPFPLVIFLLISVIFVFAVIVTYQRLVGYRANLLDEVAK